MAETCKSKYNMANRLLVIMMVVILMPGRQLALSASDSKYCKECNRSLQCPASCPDFNNGSSKSLCHIDCKTCTTQCKKNSDTPPPPPPSTPLTPGTPPPPSTPPSKPGAPSPPSTPPSTPGTPPPRPSTPPSTPETPPAPTTPSTPDTPPTPTTTPSTPDTPPTPTTPSTPGTPSTPSTPHSCNQKGAVCQDPRFIGGDGVLFYFHGKSNEDFCIVSDISLHINGHFIGKSVKGRPRDFTWVQAIGILYGSQKVSVGAKKVAIWDADVDQLEVSYDDMKISLDTLIGESWESPLGDFKIMRTKDVNSIEIEVTNLMKVSINVTYVDAEDSRIHNYGITSEDCFAHLDLLFTFFNLSSQVDGVLGQTYKQTYKSPVKVGAPMPTMGGYHKFKTSSLFATDCQVGVFDPSSYSQSSVGGIQLFASLPSMSCTSQGESGIVCRR